MPARKFIPRPDQVKVGHINYRITWLTEQEWTAKDGLGDNRGISIHASGDIYILLDWEGDRCGDAQLRETLLHEIMHCCTNVSNIWNAWDDMKGSSRKEYNRAEEVLIGCTAPVLLSVLKDNPMVVAYLLDDKEHD